MEALETLMNRRSVRAYTGEPVPREQLDRILDAGLVGPTGKGKKPWQFYVVQARETIDALASMRTPAPSAFKTADGQDSSAFASKLLGAPAGPELEAVLLVGVIKEQPAPHTEADLLRDHVTYLA